MKTKRQAKMLELIKRNDIETQEELSDYLEREGYQVTQATVSRDIRELKLTKVAMSNGRQKYVARRRRTKICRRNMCACSTTDLYPWIWRRIFWSLRLSRVWRWRWRLR